MGRCARFRTILARTAVRAAQRNIAGIVLLGIAVSTVTLDSVPSPLDADKIKLLVLRSTAITDRNWSVQQEYDFCETDLQRDGSTRTFQELMMLGTRYGRLIAIDGKPLSTAQAEEEERTLRLAMAERGTESQTDRTKRLENEQKRAKRDHALLNQIPQGFEFSYAGEQELDGHQVYVIRATPKRGYNPPNKETEVLKGMQGQLWIDRETLNWVRVEAQVMRPVWIVGFLARVEPGTRFELEMMPISGSFWMPRHYAMRARAKIFLLFTHEEQEEESYFAYHDAVHY